MFSNAVLEAEGSDLGLWRDVAGLPSRFRVLSGMDSEPLGGLIGLRLVIRGVFQLFASHAPSSFLRSQR